MKPYFEVCERVTDCVAWGGSAAVSARIASPTEMN